MVTNTAQSPESFFLDPRTSSNDHDPAAGSERQRPEHDAAASAGALVPVLRRADRHERDPEQPHGHGPVTYDIGPFPGIPISVPSNPGNGDSASLTSPREAASSQPGIWSLNPSEIGPYGPDGRSRRRRARRSTPSPRPSTPTVDPSTGDLWTADNGLTSSFSPVYLQPGESASIPLTITPTASPGTHVSGSINLDDVFQVNFVTRFTSSERRRARLAAVQLHGQVGPPKRTAQFAGGGNPASRHPQSSKFQESGRRLG